MAGTLLIGTRMYSSWSLRAWLAVKLAGLEVEDRVIALKGMGNTTEIHALSPNRRVPYLQHDGAHIWESLAICLYCADFCPPLLPEDRVVRAHVMSVSAQMSAGFAALRSECPMILYRVPAALPEVSEALAADVALLNQTLKGALTRSGRVTRYLFGDEVTIADCMYAPVAWRIALYGLEVDPVVRGWVDVILAHPLMVEWRDLALAEPADWRIEAYEKK